MQIIPLSNYSHYDYVNVVGPDAVSFLQGQLTCNLDRLSETHSLEGALCNLKGRVLADFSLLMLDKETLMLQTLAGNGERIINTLAKYAVFSKVELTAGAAPEAVTGVVGEAAAAALSECITTLPQKAHGVVAQDGFLVIRCSGPATRYQIWCQNAEASTRLQRLDVMEEAADLDAWRRAEMQAGIVHVHPGISEAYTPQLLNYDLSGVVDFDKGCYTGQEVVARMYYRGKAKKRLFLLGCSNTINSGARIVAAAGGDTVAEVVAAVPAVQQQSSLALAILPTELVRSGQELILDDSQKSAIEVLDLPYDV